MPNLSGLMERGVWGPLRSTRPPYTGPAWVTMFTGVNPGRHGIYGFTGPKTGSYDRSIRNGSMIGAERIWSRLNQAGLVTGVVNVPFTYPPSKIDGFMVSGMLTPARSEKYAEPDSIREIIARAARDYLIDVSLDMDKDWRTIDICRSLEKSLVGRESVITALLEEFNPDFLMAVFVLPDRLQHLWYRIIMKQAGWRDGDFTREVRENALKLFSRLDEAIGNLAARLSEDDILMIASDHGFTSFRHTFYLNSRLIAAGYLKLKKGGSSLSALSGFLNRTGLKRLVPHSLVRAGKARSMKDSIDWAATRAYASPGMEEGVVINLRGRQPRGIVALGDEYERLRSEIRENLLRIRDPERILNDVIRREDVYQGRYTEYSPDLLLDFAGDGWNMRETLVGRDLTRSYDGLPYGTHQSQGIWAVSGGNIAAGADPVPARIEDITPTILNLFGLPVPSSLDGEPINAIVSPIVSSQEDAATSESPHPPASGYSAEDQAEIEQRLEGLGYL